MPRWPARCCPNVNQARDPQPHLRPPPMIYSRSSIAECQRPPPALPPCCSAWCLTAPSLPAGDDGLRRALLRGYPDRVARRRANGSARFLLASGHGGVLGSESAVRDAEFIVALDVVAGKRGDGSEARIRMASAVEADWLEPTEVRVDHALDDRGVVRATSRDYYDAIVLSEQPVVPDPDQSARLLTAAFLAREPGAADAQLLRRMRFAGLPVTCRRWSLARARDAARLAKSSSPTR